MVPYSLGFYKKAGSRRKHDELIGKLYGIFWTNTMYVRPILISWTLLSRFKFIPFSHKVKIMLNNCSI